MFKYESWLLSRAMEAIQSYPEEIVKSMNGTEYFASMELHKALLESENALYEEYVEHYMIDYSVFQTDKEISSYIKDNRSFYAELEEKAEKVSYDENEKEYIYSIRPNYLEYILANHLNFEKIVEDINFHQETVKMGNINYGLTDLEIMLQDYLHEINNKNEKLTQKEKKVLRELNYMLDDI